MRGERQPIQVRPQAMLEARDLPKCEISDFLQERIDSALSAELIQRSKQEGVPPDQVSVTFTVQACTRLVQVASWACFHNVVLDTIYTRLLSCVNLLKQCDHIHAPLCPCFPTYLPPLPLPYALMLNANLGIFLVEECQYTFPRMLTGLWAMQLATAKGLTIRVINNVSKRMEVKPRFHEAFQKEGCPDAFPYRQKVPTAKSLHTMCTCFSVLPVCCMHVEHLQDGSLLCQKM